VIWLDDEEKLLGVAYRQVRRIVVRACHRPFVTLGLTLVLAGILFVFQTRRPKIYTAEVGLIVTEGVFSVDGRRRPHGELRSYIHNAIFVTTRLEKLIDKHDLTKKLGGLGKTDTVEKIRKLIDVQTTNDYFEAARQSADPPRSAHVIIAFSAPDAELALTMARELGEFVADAQAVRESEAATSRVANLRVLAEKAAVRASEQHQKLTRAREDTLSKPPGYSDLLIQELTRIARAADRSSIAAANEVLDAQIHVRATHSMGHLVQVINPGSPIWHTIPRSQRLKRQAILSLIVSSIISVILSGAFDPALRDEQDLQHSKLSLLGELTI
jgi:hypothetical protein